MDKPTTQLLGIKQILTDYANGFLQALPALAIALLVMALSIVLARYIARLVQTFATRFTPDRNLQSLAGTVTHVFVIFFGVFAGAAIVFPGLNAGTLVSVLGLSSVAIGFAFKDIFENFLAGILILSGRPFGIGDQISTNGFDGTVEHITIRSTVIRSFDGMRVLIPNARIFQNPMTVHTAYKSRRTIFTAYVNYNADVEFARQVILEAVQGCERVLNQPTPLVLLMEHGPRAMEFQVRFWTTATNEDVRMGRDQVATAIKYALDRNNIDIPYPHQVVHLAGDSPMAPRSAAPEEASAPSDLTG